MTDTKTQLKALFRSGAIPSERDFAALIDKMVLTDDLDARIGTLRDGQTPAVDADRRDEEIAVLRREKAELEARIDQELEALRRERGAIEPLLHRKDLVHRREIEAASTYLEQEISALKDERRGVQARQDREIDAIRRGMSIDGGPIDPPVKRAEGASPPKISRTVPSDGRWHALEIEPRVGGFVLVATMNSRVNVSATVAQVVVAGPGVRPAISRREACDRGWWIVLVPLGFLAVAGGTALVWFHGLAIWREPWSAAGLWLALVGLGASVAGGVLHRRRALSVRWRRSGGPFAMAGPGVFQLKSNGTLTDAGKALPISYATRPIDV